MTSVIRRTTMTYKGGGKSVGPGGEGSPVPLQSRVKKAKIPRGGSRASLVAWPALCVLVFLSVLVLTCHARPNPSSNGHSDLSQPASAAEWAEQTASILPASVLGPNEKCIYGPGVDRKGLVKTSTRRRPPRTGGGPLGNNLYINHKNIYINHPRNNLYFNHPRNNLYINHPRNNLYINHKNIYINHPRNNLYINHPRNNLYINHFHHTSYHNPWNQMW
ncbi:hypothetical protein GWK47_028183 [Chionoecetes opilio]|uniref:Uncharacterized protein n=1 Tax=Chionoecetes opilio TaxID=41210 RepID=A0A8J4YTB4_CHIOP|nr:hypothetical protein GWK47_028183 [Chionoecetes opilio]